MRLARALAIGFTGLTLTSLACLAGAETTATNVTVDIADSIAACPGGDSLGVVGHPSRLRIRIVYRDGSGQLRTGVPPESLWATVELTSQTLRVNDQGMTPAKLIFADDSTRAGEARITVPSFSGSGTAHVFVFAGRAVGATGLANKTITVRTADTDTNGIVNSDDLTNLADLNYNSQQDDSGLLTPHIDHSHRNVLFGTMVRRTNLCGTCAPTQANTIGESPVGWSPGLSPFCGPAIMTGSPS